MHQVNWRDYLNGLKATVISVHECSECGYLVISAIQVEPANTDFKPILTAQHLEPKQPCHNCN